MLFRAVGDLDWKFFFVTQAVIFIRKTQESFLKS